MSLSRSGYSLKSDLHNFCRESTDLAVFVAYIKKEPLKELLDVCGNVRFVCVRWQYDDLLKGSSDIEVYELLKDRGIPLYRNERLHLKAYINREKRAFITSANLSSRAITLESGSHYNYEVGTTISNLTAEDLLYFERIIAESILITPQKYEQLKDIVSHAIYEVNDTPKNYLVEDDIERHFLISSLPMSIDVFELYDLYANKLVESDSVKLACAIHDIALYNLELGESSVVFHERLKINFFRHPFIVAFVEELDKNDGAIYFGRAKEWIQNNCTNVPIPRRWEITENIQILYNWIVNLGEGKYAVDVPGRHSQRLFRVK